LHIASDANKKTSVDYAGWIAAQRERLAQEIEELTQGYDETTRELVNKIVGLVNLNQSLVTLQLLGLQLEMLENNRTIDRDLDEIADYVSEIIEVHQREAENLSKIL